MGTIMRVLRGGLAVLAAVWMDAAGAQMPSARLETGGVAIEVEVAVGSADQELGLMYRSRLAPDRGMVFVYPADTRICMWMRNTLIPLSVAFLDGEGRILNIEEMTPQTEDSHCARAPARYALEMNRGWFRAHGVQAGEVVGGVKSLPGEASAPK